MLSCAGHDQVFLKFKSYPENAPLIDLFVAVGLHHPSLLMGLCEINTVEKMGDPGGAHY